MPAVAFLGPCFFSPLANVRDVAAFSYHCLGGLSSIALIRAQMLDFGLWAAYQWGDQCRLQKLHVMALGTGYD
jgi:hypothetical protein